MIKKIALVACSNGLKLEEQPTIEKLKLILQSMDIEVILSPYLYVTQGYASGNGRERAEILNQYFKDTSMDAIFDVSGGDMANEVLPYLDYPSIAKSRAVFYGYSDLTTVINAIYAKTGKSSILFQLKNLVWEENGIQIERFQKYLQGDNELFQADWHVWQGEALVSDLIKNNIVLGGNVRCFLKLAGTAYFPDLTDKVLFLEASGGQYPQIATYFASLYQLGVFEKVKAILFGTFTQFEKTEDEAQLYQLLSQYIPKNLSVAKTSEIGHAKTSSALRIG